MKSCSVKGCGRRARKRGWCDSHYRQWTRGKTPGPLRVRPERRCLACGKTEWSGNGRTSCSVACKGIVDRWGATRPTSKSCARCGERIDLTAKGKCGRLKRADSSLCNRCRAEKRWPVSVSWLARRDDGTCGICGELVDMTLRAPHAMRPSVDHVVPRARGGVDDPSNLQLAHLWCNQVKSTQLPEGVRCGN